MPTISQYNNFYFLRYLHVRYEKRLFTKIQKLLNMLKISLLKKKTYKFHGEIIREFLGLRMRTFQGIVFI